MSSSDGKNRLRSSLTVHSTYPLLPKFMITGGGTANVAYFRDLRGSRAWSTWEEAVRLAVPVTVEKEFRALMRTTDVLVAGLISPAAVAGVGIGNAFSQIVNRVGGGLASATIAISSQDTGTEAHEIRDEAIAQAFVLGLLLGLPFVAFGLAFSNAAIAILGAEASVIRMGGQYLAVIMMASPMLHLSRIGSKALQGTGDTKTPMYIRGLANVINIVGTLVLAFGLGPFPALSIVGIALATVLGETVATILLLVAIYGRWCNIQFILPAKLGISKQILIISIPKFAEGVTKMVADIPFNAVLLIIGTEANAAYHIARRVYRQVLHPIRSGFGVSANILVGQSLTEPDDVAYRTGALVMVLAVGITTIFSMFLVWKPDLAIQVFTNDAVTSEFGIVFLQAFAIAGIFHAADKSLQGTVQGGSDTRSPFYAKLVGTFVFLLGISYAGGVYLGFGAVAVAVAIVLQYVWRAGFLGVVYYRRSWVEFGTRLMEERGSVKASTETDN